MDGEAGCLVEPSANPLDEAASSPTFSWDCTRGGLGEAKQAEGAECRERCSQSVMRRIGLMVAARASWLGLK